MAEMRSTSAWKDRRQGFVKNIGINYASRLIPIMQKIVSGWLAQKRSGKINMSEEASKITFDVITNILFGGDINTKIEYIPYYDAKSNSTILMNAHDSITKISEA